MRQARQVSGEKMYVLPAPTRLAACSLALNDNMIVLEQRQHIIPGFVFVLGLLRISRHKNKINDLEKKPEIKVDKPDEHMVQLSRSGSRWFK